MGVSWEYRNAAPGFGYAGGFSDILSSFNGLNHRGANVRYASSQPLLQEQMTHLYQLKEALEKEEDEFFRIFGIFGKDKKECFRILKEKVKTWDATGAGIMVNDRFCGAFYAGINEIQREAVAAEISMDEWDNILTEAFEAVDRNSLQKMIEDKMNIAQILNEILAEEKKKGKFSSSSKSTLVQNLQIIIDEKGEIKVVSNKDKISPQLQLKIINKLKKFLSKKTKRQPKYNFQAMFDTLFSKWGIDSIGQTYIKMALRNYINVLSSYDFSSDQNKIKGFLGEVYNNAFLIYMASNGGDANAINRITPTGALRNYQGQEIVIDTWLEGFGIQVKNYEKNKVMKKGFKFQKSYNVGNFIKDALQLSSSGEETSVGDILLNFFTAYAYNQDYGEVDPTVKLTEAYRYWRTDRDRMEEKYRDNKTFTNIFMPYVDKLIGIDRSFGTENGMFVEGQEYHNTFFNISGNYIPSSVLVQAIIDTIEKKSQGSLANLMRVHFSSPSYQGNSLGAWNPDVTNADVGIVTGKRVEYANQSRISYTITLNIDELVNTLLL